MYEQASFKYYPLLVLIINVYDLILLSCVCTILFDIFFTTVITSQSVLRIQFACSLSCLVCHFQYLTSSSLSYHHVTTGMALDAKSMVQEPAPEA